MDMGRDVIRAAGVDDVAAMFHVRAHCSENAITPDRLAAMGITPASLQTALREGQLRSWVCQTQGQVVGFCGADAGSGEVTVLAVLAGHERRGIGRALLAQALRFLQAAGCPKIWLAASADAGLRSHGFYRANGWRPSGRLLGQGDEELVYAAA